MDGWMGWIVKSWVKAGTVDPDKTSGYAISLESKQNAAMGDATEKYKSYQYLQ